MSQIFALQNRTGQFQTSEMSRRFRQKVSFPTDKAHQRHDHFFAQGVDRRIGDLSELLFEIVEQNLRAFR